MVGLNKPGFAVTPASGLWIIVTGIATLATAAWVVAFVDCVYRRYPSRKEKLIWFILILLGHGPGALIYWFVGRERGTAGGA